MAGGAADAAPGTDFPALPNSADFADTPPPALAAESCDAPGKSSPRLGQPAVESAREYQRGGASWYGPGFHGKRTASGERYDMNAMTAAHRTLPFGTWVRIRSLVNGREVNVRITDRGPFIAGRVIDVSRGAADALGMLGLGFKQVVLLLPDSVPAAVRAEIRPTSLLVNKQRVARREYPVR